MRRCIEFLEILCKHPLLHISSNAEKDTLFHLHRIIKLTAFVIWLLSTRVEQIGEIKLSYTVQIAFDIIQLYPLPSKNSNESDFYGLHLALHSFFGPSIKSFSGTNLQCTDVHSNTRVWLFALIFLLKLFLTMIKFFTNEKTKREVCYLGSGDGMQLSTQINHIEDKLGKRPVSRQMYG